MEQKTYTEGEVVSYMNQAVQAYIDGREAAGRSVKYGFKLGAVSVLVGAIIGLIAIEASKDKTSKKTEE